MVIESSLISLGKIVKKSKSSDYILNNSWYDKTCAVIYQT